MANLYSSNAWIGLCNLLILINSTSSTSSSSSSSLYKYNNDHHYHHQHCRCPRREYNMRPERHPNVDRDLACNHTPTSPARHTGFIIRRCTCRCLAFKFHNYPLLRHHHSTWSLFIPAIINILSHKKQGQQQQRRLWQKKRRQTTEAATKSRSNIDPAGGVTADLQFWTEQYKLCQRTCM